MVRRLRQGQREGSKRFGSIFGLILNLLRLVSRTTRPPADSLKRRGQFTPPCAWYSPNESRRSTFATPAVGSPLGSSGVIGVLLTTCPCRTTSVDVVENTISGSPIQLTIRGRCVAASTNSLVS